MLKALYIALSVLLLYISYKDIREAQYSSYYFYFIIAIVTYIAILRNIAYTKLIIVYFFLIISFIFRERYIKYIGDGDVDIYIALLTLYSFEEFIYLILISTITAILVNIIRNKLNKSDEKTVRLVPYITFAYFILEIFSYVRGI